MEKFKHRYAPNVFYYILCFVVLVDKSYFFSEQPFYGNYGYHRGLHFVSS